MSACTVTQISNEEINTKVEQKEDIENNVIIEKQEKEELCPKKINKTAGMIYEKRNNCVYFEGGLIKDIDYDTFEDLGYYYAKDKKSIIFWGGRKLDFDYNTFKVLNHYAYDKNHVYYQGRFLIDYNESFQSFNEKYAQDKNNVYYGLSIIKEADLETFLAIDEAFAEDKNYLFRFGKIYSVNVHNNNLPELIEYLDFGYYLYKDRIYYKGIYLQKILNNDYKILKDRLAIIGNFVYSGENIIEEADAKTFEHLGYGYSKDKNNVYLHDKIVEGADPATFNVFAD